MDSQSMYSSYRRYKANTNAVDTWSLTTARRYGCHAYDSNDRSPAASAATPRLKCKSRKLAREADTAAGKPARPTTPIDRIETKDFILLAQFIANSTKPRIKVSDYTVRDLQQAIKMRKSHQAWLAMVPSQIDSAAADQAHTYFVQTLEAALEILRPNMPEAFRTESVRNVVVVVKEYQMTNIFDNLTVEEPEDSYLEIRRQDAAEKISVTVSDSAEWEKVEAFLASVYLSRDAHRFREAIQEGWTFYEQGRMDVMAAAITTNTAIEFCRKLQEDFEAMFPRQEKLHELGCLYCSFLRASNSHSRDEAYWNNTCLTPAREILLTFTDMIKERARCGTRSAS